MRYGAFTYGQAKYGEGVGETQLWTVLADWNGDGVYDLVNEAARMTGLLVRRGRKNLLNSSGTGFQPVDVGELTIDLDNSDGRYHPFNVNSPLYPYVRPGVKLKVLTRLPETGSEFPVFAGQIVDIIPLTGGATYERVKIIAHDGLEWLADQEVDLPLQQNQHVDDIIGAVLAAADWPWGSSLETSSDIVPWFWAPSNVKVRELLHDLASSYLGTFFVGADGSARFYTRDHDLIDPNYQLTQEQISTDIMTRSPWDVIKNQITVTSHPRTQQATAVVWKLGEIPYLPRGATFDVWGEFSMNGEKGPISSYITPTWGVDCKTNDKPDGSGGSASVTVTATVYADKVHFVIYGSILWDQYITLLQLRGTFLASSPSVALVSDASSVALHGPKKLSVDSLFLQDSSLAANLAAEILNLLKAPKMYLTIKIVGRPELQYTVDLFDNIDVMLEKLGISGKYRIGHIEHEWLSENGQVSQTIFELEPIL